MATTTASPDPQLSQTQLQSQSVIQATDIPKRTSSHAAVFHDSAGNQISPSSPPNRKSSKRPMSGSVDAATYNAAHGKQPVAHSRTASGHRPFSSHFPAGASTAYTTAGASAIASASQPIPSATATKSRTRSSSTKKIIQQHPLNMAPQSHVSLVPDEDAHGGAGSGKQAKWSEAKEKILLGPFDYLYGHPGKDIRSQLIGAFNAWLRVPEASLKIITKVVGMLHTASLLVDDVEDSSLLRRGAPVANSIFGTAQTINSANYVYFLALKELTLLSNPLAISIYTDELLNLHRGQGMDLFWRDTLTTPTEADYLEMVGNKTGGLFRLAIKLMQAESGEGRRGVDCVPLVSTIGLLFQILDDLLNLSSPTYTARKGLCEDLTEGKFSFPVIHAIRADPSNLVLLNVLAQKTNDDEVKRYAVRYMEKVGSFEYTKGVIKELEGKALGLIAELEKQVGGEDGRAGADGVRGILGKLKTL